ncbi:unnamed protein product [Cyprideis torosa]|uniref:Pescadillo homolog n=1 Tax=Cyprideis torosa TaxID=163714 RepID=A0A7R8ZL52_9CRUS|nr:unnamed protein product [Cyprideis torosa]CAG0881601.1 unnamed protein product [Cyprideis torosa]
MGKIKPKGKSGEATRYYSRSQALKRLQLSLSQFRDVCILKGIYPREPKHRKKAQKGSSAPKTLYLRKDIQFLMHEPIIWKLRALKIFYRKLTKAREKKDTQAFKRLLENKPRYKIDHIIKERYPTFVDALRDLDDPLSICFLYATFPTLRSFHQDFKACQLARRLTLEFMHYVIEARALRKVFIAIKGFYFQAEIMGQMITWIVPHQFSYTHPYGMNIDFKVMNTFAEFYTTLLGFVNFRLYHVLGLHYPPVLKTHVTMSAEEEESEMVIASLCHRLSRSQQDPAEAEMQGDAFPTLEGEDAESTAAKMAEFEKFKKLFEGLKVFLNREVPREPFAFVLRCFGADVSWDSTGHPGATFGQDDLSITHEIVDRPLKASKKKVMNRFYVQPQWIFDCVNQRKLLPPEDYFPGAVLPPHLSPFVEADTLEEENDDKEDEGESLSLVRQEEEMDRTTNEEEKKGKEEDNEEEEQSEEEEEEESEVEGEEESEEGKEDSGEEEESGEEVEEMKEKEKKVSSAPPMKVSRGKAEQKPDPEDVKVKEEKEHLRMRELMIRKKHRYLYKKIRQRERREEKERRALITKRKAIKKADKAATPAKEGGGAIRR